MRLLRIFPGISGNRHRCILFVAEQMIDRAGQLPSRSGIGGCGPTSAHPSVEDSQPGIRSSDRWGTVRSKMETRLTTGTVRLLKSFPPLIFLGSCPPPRGLGDVSLRYARRIDHHFGQSFFQFSIAHFHLLEQVPVILQRLSQHKQMRRWNRTGCSLGELDFLKAELPEQVAELQVRAFLRVP
jgi:hypothetical protein